ncbi:MAG: hypothetical protein H8M99_13240 [Gloeobacteraceae cyanobacterium ES-bin-144]|nr:hypothetical protein [Verrucomicrobiales bacterium]
MKRRLIDRLHDRAWSEIGVLLSIQSDIEKPKNEDKLSSSISASTTWPAVCAAFAANLLGSRNFRRTTAVRNIVETVGAVEGRFYARRIREWGPDWLANSQIEKVDSWGDPIRWSGFLLGTSRNFSPTTLRYLATALWLKRTGFLKRGTELIEIGVGFGGLAAMNAIVSKSITTLVDLPEVEHAAMRMLTENGLAEYARLRQEHDLATKTLVISNYAFTELDKENQNEYFYRFLKHAEHGVIISNSFVFSESICGRSDDELLTWFIAEGLPAKLEKTNSLLGPGDHLNHVSMIYW